MYDFKTMWNNFLDSMKAKPSVKIEPESYPKDSFAECMFPSEVIEPSLIHTTFITKEVKERMQFVDGIRALMGSQVINFISLKGMPGYLFISPLLFDDFIKCLLESNQTEVKKVLSKPSNLRTEQIHPNGVKLCPSFWKESYSTLGDFPYWFKPEPGFLVNHINVLQKGNIFFDDIERCQHAGRAILETRLSLMSDEQELLARQALGDLRQPSVVSPDNQKGLFENIEKTLLNYGKPLPVYRIRNKFKDKGLAALVPFTFEYSENVFLTKQEALDYIDKYMSTPHYEVCECLLCGVPMSNIIKNDINNFKEIIDKLSPSLDYENKTPFYQPRAV